MVRNIIGAMVDYSKGKVDFPDLKQMLNDLNYLGICQKTLRNSFWLMLAPVITCIISI